MSAQLVEELVDVLPHLLVYLDAASAVALAQTCGALDKALGRGEEELWAKYLRGDKGWDLHYFLLALSYSVAFSYCVRPVLHGALCTLLASPLPTAAQSSRGTAVVHPLNYRPLVVALGERNYSSKWFKIKARASDRR
jgi:hypothetical protein